MAKHDTTLLVHDSRGVVARIYFASLGGIFPLHGDVGFLHCAVGPRHFFDGVPPFVPEGLKSWLLVRLSCGHVVSC